MVPVDRGARDFSRNTYYRVVIIIITGVPKATTTVIILPNLPYSPRPRIIDWLEGRMLVCLVQRTKVPADHHTLRATRIAGGVPTF